MWLRPLPRPLQGNLQFTSGEDDQLIIENQESVSAIAALLGCPPEAVQKALCYRVVGNKLGSVDKMHTVQQAEYGRDAFAKVPTLLFLTELLF